MTKPTIYFRIHAFSIFSSSYAMDWLYVYIFVHLFIPANFVLHNKTYGNLEFIFPGDSTSLRLAQRWCKQHGSTLAEITEERIWNLTFRFVDEFNLRTDNLILNAESRELPDWQWVTGGTFKDERNYYSFKDDTRMYAHISTPLRYSANISVIGSSPDCMNGSCKHSYVCAQNKYSSCNIQDFSINSTRIDGTCYVFYHRRFVTWFEAFYACEKNNGRLATFRNIKAEERNIAAQLEYGSRYWIGLQRFEWRWAESKQLITYARWATPHPHQYHACAHVNFVRNEWYSTNQCTNHDSQFVCIRDVTKCASNLCQNGAMCVSSIFNYTCHCVSGFTGSQCEQRLVKECVGNPCENGATCQDVVNNITCSCLPGFTGSWCQTDINQCDSSPCQNGGTCVGSIYNHTCSCPNGFTGSECQSASNQTAESHGFSNMQILIISALAIILVTLIIILPVIIYKRIYKTRKSNDARLSSKHATTIESATRHAGENEYDGKDGAGPEYVNTIPCLESGIYGQVVSSENDDQRKTVTSSSLVYADLEFSQQFMQVETHSDPAPGTQQPSSCTGPMGDVYAMVEK